MQISVTALRTKIFKIVDDWTRKGVGEKREPYELTHKGRVVARLSWSCETPEDEAARGLAVEVKGLPGEPESEEA